MAFSTPRNVILDISTDPYRISFGFSGVMYMFSQRTTFEASVIVRVFLREYKFP